MIERNIRILGLTLERVADFRTNPLAKNSGLYAALDRRYDVVGVVRPALTKPEEYLNRLRTIHPDRNYWRQRRSLNAWAFRQRTAHAEAQLRAKAGQYDLIMQLHTLFAPEAVPAGQRYVLHTDNAYLISERLYKSWAPLRGRDREEWLRRERAVYQHAAFLFPRSKFLRQVMIEDYGCDPNRVIAVGGGGNYGQVSLENKRYDGQIALFVGFDFERKGGVELLQAWERVHKKLPAAQLWIVGPKRARRQLPGVTWLGPIADRQALAERYRQASLFVMPSLFEPWGHVFFEAMSFGLPCIGSTCCAIPEIIDSGVTGLLAETGESEPLAEALIALLGDPTLAERMGHAASARVAQGGTWDNVVDRMAPYIEQAASPHAAVGRI
jgi:starch synthase